MTDTTLASAPVITSAKPRKRIRALLLSDRIDTSNLEHDGVVSTAPLTFKYGNGGLVTLFRYGVAVLMGLTAAEEEHILRSLRLRLVRPGAPSREGYAGIGSGAEKDDKSFS